MLEQEIPQVLNNFNNIDDYIFTNLVSHILISSMVLPLLKKKQKGNIIYRHK